MGLLLHQLLPVPHIAHLKKPIEALKLRNSEPLKATLKLGDFEPSYVSLHLQPLHRLRKLTSDLYEYDESAAFLIMV